MLRQSIGVDLSDLTWVAIDALVQNKTPESQRLDFKQEVARAENRDFAVDAAAMANGGGGVIIVGVADRNDAAYDFNRLDLAGQSSHLEQVLIGNVHPYLRVDARPVEDPATPGFGVVVIEVHPSERAPYAVMDGAGRFIWKTRVGQHNQPLSEPDVERMYRERFTRRVFVDERLHELKRLASHEHNTIGIGRLVVAVVPTAPLPRRFRITRELVREMSTLHGTTAHVLPQAWIGQPIPRYARPALRHIHWSATEEAEPKWTEERGWVELHDDGAFMSVMPGVRTDIGRFGWVNGVEYATTFTDDALVVTILSQLSAYARLANRFELSGDIACAATLTPIREACYLDASVVNTPGTRQRRIDAPITTSLSLASSDLLTGPGLVSAAKWILDDLFHAVGWAGCDHVTVDGKLVMHYFDRQTSEAIEPWKLRHGVEWA